MSKSKILRKNKKKDGTKLISSLMVRSKKTKKTVSFTLSETTCEALQTWIEFSGKRGADFLFSSCTKNYDGKRLKQQPISQVQYQRLVKSWLESLGAATDDFSTHS